MRYFFILFILMSLSSFGQDYKTLIVKHIENYKQDFLNDAHAPLKKEDLKDLHFFDADSTYLVTAKIEILMNENSFPMSTYTGSSREYIRYGLLTFMLNGKPCQLTVYKSLALSKNIAYRDHLFLPFTDQTNARETYAGGRYIDLNTREVKDGGIQIDFNKAYNPYCAYSDGYQCPKPPEENQLQLEIKAGEKLYTGEKKHQ